MSNPLETYIKDDYEIGLEEGYNKGWDECLKKVLKILDRYHEGKGRDGFKYIDIEALEKIEKL